MFQGELSVIEEAGMSVIEVPSTPQKNVNPTMGVSSQILPLSRLSLSSSGGGGGISPTSSQASSTDKGNNSSNSSSGSGPDGEAADVPAGTAGELKQWPVRDKLMKLRKSFTEPLVQYFQDLQVTPSENEEPEILNTPRSLTASEKNIATMSHSTPKNSSDDGSAARKRSRNLLSAMESHAEEDGEDDANRYENMPPIIVTDM